MIILLSLLLLLPLSYAIDYCTPSSSSNFCILCPKNSVCVGKRVVKCTDGYVLRQNVLINGCVDPNSSNFMDDAKRKLNNLWAMVQDNSLRVYNICVENIDDVGKFVRSSYHSIMIKVDKLDFTEIKHYVFEKLDMGLLALHEFIEVILAFKYLYPLLCFLAVKKNK